MGLNQKKRAVQSALLFICYNWYNFKTTLLVPYLQLPEILQHFEHPNPELSISCLAISALVP